MMINSRTLNYKLLISKLINTEYIKCFFNENSELSISQEYILSKYFDKFSDLIIFFYAYLKSPDFNPNHIHEIAEKMVIYKQYFNDSLNIKPFELYDDLFNIIYQPVIDDIFNTIITSITTSKNTNNPYKLFNECVNKLFMFFDLASLLVSGLNINKITDFPDDENIEIYIIPEQSDHIAFINNYLNTLLNHPLTKEKKLNIIINTNYISNDLSIPFTEIITKYENKFNNIEIKSHSSELESV